MIGFFRTSTSGTVRRSATRTLRVSPTDQVDDYWAMLVIYGKVYYVFDLTTSDEALRFTWIQVSDPRSLS